ncbi:MAG TPA: hypothetical protein VMW62_10270 [Chloroflexota bacterium]|nr:hypothetical protein [Chloroflexota bacterium]
MVNVQLQLDEALDKAKSFLAAATAAERSANPFGMWRSYLAAGNAYAEAANLADASLASKLWKDAARMYEKAQAKLPPPLPARHRA